MLTTPTRRNSSSSMLVTAIGMKRVATLPFIIAVGVFNVLYGVYLSTHSSMTTPFHSRSTMSGPDESNHHKRRRATAAIQNFVKEHDSQQQAGEPQSHGDEDGGGGGVTGPRSLHKLHKKGLPSLIIHVGPQYTFASELQAELVAMQSELEADQYSLQIITDDKNKQRESVGALLTDVQCHQALSLARQRYNVPQQKGRKGKKKPKQQSLKDYLSTEVRCWKRALAALDDYRTKGQSVIISNERISSQWYKSSNGLGGGSGSGLASLDFMALHETLRDAWNVEVVVAYRRYAEWLPDAVRGAAEYRYQQVKQMGSISPLLLSTRRVVVDVNNAAILPLVPDLIESAAVTGQAIVGGGNTQLENATYTATVLERYLSLDVSSTSTTAATSSSSSSSAMMFPITLFNVHDNDLSLGGHFVCRLLYHATSACRSHVQHTASLSRDFADAEHKRNREPAQAQDFYDLLAIYGGQQHLYNTDVNTVQQAAISFRYHQEEMLHLTPSDLPVKCPTPEQLQLLIDVSLKHEQTLLPSFAASHNGNEEHRRSIQEINDETRKLCVVNVKKVFNDHGMRDFARDMPRGVPTDRFLPKSGNDKTVAVSGQTFVDAKHPIVHPDVETRQIVLPQQPNEGGAKNQPKKKKAKTTTITTIRHRVISLV